MAAVKDHEIPLTQDIFLKIGRYSCRGTVKSGLVNCLLTEM